MAGSPAAGYNFNTMQEIKSHSSVLFNERVAILFYLLDMKSIELNTHYSLEMLMEVRAIIKQIYKNVRMLIRNNPTVRATLNLNTKDDGIYVTDVMMGVIDGMVKYCQTSQFSPKRIYILVEELNTFEMKIKDILQYFHYFIRPDFRQKPDIDMATETYKEIADKRTIEELREIVGKRNRIDFDNLGTNRIELNNEVEYDEAVDGPKLEDEEIEELEENDEDSNI